jgi:hypothetical protein
VKRHLLGTALVTGMLTYATVAQATAIYTFDVGDVVTVGQATPFATMTVNFDPFNSSIAEVDVKAAPGYAFSNIFLNISLPLFVPPTFNMPAATVISTLLPNDLIGYRVPPGTAIVTPFGSMNGPQIAFDPLSATPLVTEALIGIQNLTGPWTDESKVLTGAIEAGLPSQFVASLAMFDLNNLGRQFNASTSIDGPVCQPSCTRGSTTVPEPSSFLVLLAGLLGLGFAPRVFS